MKTELLIIPIGSNDYREHQFGYTRTVIRFKKGKRIVKSFFSFNFNKKRS